MLNNACEAKTHSHKARFSNAVNQVPVKIYSTTSYKHDYAKVTPITTGEAWTSKLSALWFENTNFSNPILELSFMAIPKEIHNQLLWSTLLKDLGLFLKFTTDYGRTSQKQSGHASTGSWISSDKTAPMWLLREIEAILSVCQPNHCLSTFLRYYNSSTTAGTSTETLNLSISWWMKRDNW